MHRRPKLRIATCQRLSWEIVGKMLNLTKQEAMTFVPRFDLTVSSHCGENVRKQFPIGSEQRDRIEKAVAASAAGGVGSHMISKPMSTVRALIQQASFAQPTGDPSQGVTFIAGEAPLESRTGA